MGDTAAVARKNQDQAAEDDRGVDNLKAADCGTEKGNTFEYEAQHFGFTPITLLNGMFNAVCDLYRDALKAFCKTCYEKYPTAMSEEELRKARHAVGELIDKDICSMFDTLEFYLLHKVFSIPENVVLPEDKCQLERHSVEQENELDRKKNDVKRRIIAIKYANAVLSQHLEDAEAFQSSLDEVLEHMSSSESNISQMGGKGLTDLISYYSETLKKGLKTTT